MLLGMNIQKLSSALLQTDAPKLEKWHKCKWKKAKQCEP